MREKSAAHRAAKQLRQRERAIESRNDKATQKAQADVAACSDAIDEAA